MKVFLSSGEYEFSEITLGILSEMLDIANQNARRAIKDLYPEKSPVEIARLRPYSQADLASKAENKASADLMSDLDNIVILYWLCYKRGGGDKDFKAFREMLSADDYSALSVNILKLQGIDETEMQAGGEPVEPF